MLHRMTTGGADLFSLFLTGELVTKYGWEVSIVATYCDAHEMAWVLLSLLIES